MLKESFPSDSNAFFGFQSTLEKMMKNYPEYENKTISEVLAMGVKTESSPDWSLYPNFSKHEFACRCCGEIKVSEDLVQKLQKARIIYGKPISLTSTYRCLSHNRNVGSRDTSSHVKGDAADIRILGSHDRLKLVAALISVGFKRIGVYKNDKFIHADVDMSKPDAMWVG